MTLRFGSTSVVAAAALVLLAGSAFAQATDTGQQRSISVDAKTPAATPDSTAKLPPIPAELKPIVDAAKEGASVVVTPAPAPDTAKADAPKADTAAVTPAPDAAKADAPKADTAAVTPAPDAAKTGAPAGVVAAPATDAVKAGAPATVAPPGPPTADVGKDKKGVVVVAPGAPPPPKVVEHPPAAAVVPDRHHDYHYRDRYSDDDDYDGGYSDYGHRHGRYSGDSYHRSRSYDNGYSRY